jgi:hypothetical protein
VFLGVKLVVPARIITASSELLPEPGAVLVLHSNLAQAHLKKKVKQTEAKKFESYGYLAQQAVAEIKKGVLRVVLPCKEFLREVIHLTQCAKHP